MERGTATLHRDGLLTSFGPPAGIRGGSELTRVPADSRAEPLERACPEHAHSLSAPRAERPDQSDKPTQNEEKTEPLIGAAQRTLYHVTNPEAGKLGQAVLFFF